MTETKKENTFRKDLILIIISAMIGAILGIGGTLFTQHIQNKNNKINFHKRLFVEINDNTRRGSLMENLGDFKGFEISIWKEFHGSPAFWEIPIETRDLLEKYYFFLQVYNDYPSSWKQLDKKEEGEMTIGSLNTLTKNYFFFLVKKGILKTEEIASEKDIKRIK